MENSISTGTGYINTYILGSIKAAEECTEIILYNRNDFETNPEYRKISLYNLSEIYKLVLSSKKYVRLRRETAEDKFSYVRSSIINGFNVIIYVGNSSSASIGYTEFINTQGLSRDVNISLEFEVDVKKGLNIKITNSLTSIKNSETYQDKLSDNLESYTSSSKILKNINLSDFNFNYTNHLSNLKLGRKDTCAILINNSAVINSSTIAKLDIVNNLKYDPYELGFVNFQVGFYKSDIVLYVWDNGNNGTWLFNVFSLTKINRFGLPISYTLSSTERNLLVLGNDVRILYFAGQYIVCSKNDEIMLFNFENRDLLNTSENEKKKWFQKSNNNIFIDSNNIKNTIREYPKILNYKTALDFIPELNNVYIKLKTSSIKYSIIVLRKIGEWFIFEKKILNQANEYIYMNMRTAVYISEKEYNSNKIHILNNQLLIIDYEDCYKIYGYKTGEFYTSNEYDADSVKIILKSEKIFNTPLNLFRRGCYPSSNIPEIVCTFGGLIFYRENDTLNYL